MKTMLLSFTLLGACASEPSAIDRATCGEPRSYQIDSIELARNGAVARELAVDLDLDQHGFVDNQLGQVTATLTGMFQNVPLDLEATATAHFATDTDWRITIAECEGTGRIAALSSGATDALDLEGTAAGIVTLRGPGAAVPLTALLDGTGTAVPVFMTAEVAQLELDVGVEELSGKLGVALEGGNGAFLAVRAMTPFLDQHLDVGFGDIDNNGDGALTEDEVATNGVVQALLEPDIVIGGVEAMSFGMRVHATRIR
jgi:hypothetical protein